MYQDELIRTPFQKGKACFFASLTVGFGLYVQQDFPTLQSYYREEFQDVIQDFTEYYSNIMAFSLLLIAVTVLCVGVLCDHYGAEVLLFSVQFLRTMMIFLNLYAVRFKNPALLAISRLVLSNLGSTSQIIGAQQLSQLYDQHELGVPASILGMFCVIFQGSNMYFSPLLTQEYGLLISIMFGFLLNIIGLFLVSLNWYDTVVFEKLAEEWDEELELCSIPKGPSLKQQSSYNYNNSANQSCISNVSKKQEFQEIYYSFLHYGTNYWIICFILVVFQINYSMVDLYGNVFTAQHWKMSFVEANQTESIFPFISLLLPIVGYLVDKFSNQIDYFLLAAVFCLLISMVLLIQFSAINGFIVFGIGLLIKNGVVIPLISLIIGTGNIGLPYSITKSVSDVFAFVAGYLGGKYVKNFNNEYTFLYWGSFLFSCIAIILCLSLIIRLRQKTINIETITYN